MPRDPELIKRNVAKMRAQGADDKKVRQYLENVEGLKPKAMTQEPTAPKGPDAASKEILAPVAQGATFGFADEILGGIDAADKYIKGDRNFKENYEKGRDKVRGKTKEYSDANPKTSFVAELAGGAIPAVGGVAKAALKGGALRSALQGSAAGGVAGAGYSEGETVGEVAGDVAQGVALGGVAGAVLPAAARGVGKAVKATGRAVGRGVGKISAPGTLGEEIGEGAASATRKVNEERARKIILKSLSRDKVDPSELASRIAKAKGKPVGIADIAGENTQELLATASRVPSSAKQGIVEGIENRHMGQLGRISEDIESTLGMSRQNVFDLAEELIKRRKTNAQPLYDEAYKAVGAIDDDAVREILSTPAGKAAYRQALVDAENNFRKLPSIHKQIQRESGVLGPDGKPVMIDDIEFTQAPNLETLDYVKRAFDRMGKWGQNIPSGGTASTDAATAKSLSRKLVGLLDEKVPQYKTARSQFAGDLSLEDALESGRAFLKDEARVTAKALSRMTEGEREMYRIGALDAIRSAMDNATDGADLVRKIFSKPSQRERLRVLMGSDEGFRQLQDALGIESKMARTRATVTGNSATSKRLRADKDFDEMAAGNGLEGFITDAAQSGAKGALVRRALDAIKQRRLGVVGDVADEVGGYLTKGIDGNEQELQSFLAQLLRAQQPQGLPKATPGGILSGLLAGSTAQ